MNFLGELLDALGLERASLVGISMGGAVALGYALRAPEQVDRLALVNSYGLGEEVPWPRVSYALVRRPFVNELTWWILRHSKRVARWSLGSLVHRREALTKELVEETVRAVREPGVGRAFRSFQKNEIARDGLRTDYTSELHELQTPTLIVHGEGGSLVPVSWARRSDRLIPDSELLVFGACGHWPMREQSERFNKALRHFLAGEDQEA